LLEIGTDLRYIQEILGTIVEKQLKHTPMLVQKAFRNSFHHLIFYKKKLILKKEK
jgi:hypothetical protein